MIQNNRLLSKSELIKEDDHVYYNISIFPDRTYVAPKVLQAQFLEVRSDAILDKPEDYHMSVIRFSIPGENIPIFIYPHVKNSQTGIYTVNNNVYSVTLSTGGNDYQTFITYVSNTTVFNSTQIEYYYIFSYQSFINMINTAFTGSFAALKAANPGVTATRPPYLVYDPINEIISLIFQNSYLGSISVFIIGILNLFFDNFNVVFNNFGSPNGKDVQFILPTSQNNCYSECPQNIVINTTTGSPIITSAGLFSINNDGATVSSPNIPANTTATFNNVNQMTLSENATATGQTNAIFQVNNLIKMTQEFSSLFYWNELKSIAITSSNIPTKKEFLPEVAEITEQTLNVFQSQYSSSNNNFRRVIADFEPQITTGTDSRQIIQYLPTAEYRRIDLKGTVPLTMFDIQVYWVSIYGIFYPITLLPFSNSVSVKILFEKKSRYKVT